MLRPVVASKAPGSPTAYTKTFSGTSSASPIIAGAALALQGISEAYLGTSFSPLNMRSMLSVVATGTTSANPSVEKIGVMPDLKKIVTVSMGLTPAVILAKDLAALVNELLGGGLIPRPLCHTFGKAMPVLKAGSKGPQVEFLQRALAHIKHPTGAFDGIFGEQTKAAGPSIPSLPRTSPRWDSRANHMEYNMYLLIFCALCHCIMSCIQQGHACSKSRIKRSASRIFAARSSPHKTAHWCI